MGLGFRNALDRPFLVSVNREVLINYSVNLIEVHSVKPELSKGSIINTYTEDQSKKINR